MHIQEKLLMEKEEFIKEGPIIIVAFGDSVTHGALLHETNYETVYWNLLRKKIQALRDYIPVNVIDAGISGTTAATSIERVEKQVLAHHPDLIIICFGLNDVNDELEIWLNSLRNIFERCIGSGADVIFMTPNMLNTYVAEDTLENLKNYAAITAEYQNSGRMDLYMESAINLAKEMGICVCDCYAKWKELAKTKDTTQLLINRINHPTAEMHHLFADSLFELLFCKENRIVDNKQNLMYEKN